jgi:TolB-like protein/tetratricopeptide (TPR) repeat protein
MDQRGTSAGKDGSERNTEAADAVRPVFVSYASQDVVVAHRVCAALEAAGLRCWIAPRDVRAGEPYAAAIVEAINSCRMLVLVLTQSAIDSPHVLREVERASSKKRSVLSIRLDAANLPPELEYFLSANHWLEASSATIESVFPALIESVRGRDTGHIGLALSPAHSAGAAQPPAGTTPSRTLKHSLIAIGVVVVAALGYFVADRLWLSKRGTTAAVVASTPNALGAAMTRPGSATTAFAPPPHSIAVLPFVNMSGDPKQDYFSDGLSEELLNSLSSVRDLRVAARTSSFFFKGKEVDLADVAHKLNVGAVLEGSVRKDGEHVRITAQLISAETGFHIWSHTYDRDLKDILKLQTEIATAVTTSLQATLMADTAATIELGGTQNPKAFDAYLRGKNSSNNSTDRATVLSAIAAFDEAIRLDPSYAKAYASKALSENGFAEYYGQGSEIREHFQRARAAAERSLALAPELGEAHSAFALVLAHGFFDFNQALAENERALALSPNDPGVLLRAGWFFTDIGRPEAGAAMARRGVSLDQLNPRAYRTLAVVLADARLYREAIEAANRALSLSPSDVRQAALRGEALLQLGDVEAARQSCDTPPLDWESRLCLAIAYDKLHRRSDAEAEVAAMKADLGDASAYQFAEIYAQWGDVPKALDWLDTAYRLRDPGLIGLKVDDLFAPLRREPRFQEIERKLNIPN